MDGVSGVVSERRSNGESADSSALHIPIPQPIAFDNNTLQTAVRKWQDSPVEAEEELGPISFWDVSAVTDMSVRAPASQAQLPSTSPPLPAPSHPLP